MALYRVTIRYGAPRHQYHIADITAETLRDAVIAAASEVPAAATSPDLLEIRLHQEREDRDVSAG